MSYYRQGPFRPPGSGMSIGVPPVTPYVKLLIIVNGVIWLLQLLLDAIGVRIFGLRIEEILGVVPFLAVYRGCVWQPLTYMFLHSPANVMHIVFNMLMVWMFGGDLERYWGSRAFLRYYLVCGVGGGLFTVAWGLARGELLTSTIGASGAVYGLLIAFGMIFAERRVLFMLIFPMKARTMALIFFGITLILLPTGGLVSHIGHLGGAVTGFLFLKRAWRVGELYRELKWTIRRRRFKVMTDDRKDDSDRWIH